MNLPLVSAVMPAFNGAAYVGDAIRSALEQTHPNVEVVVVDDGSTDETAAICRSFGERVRCVSQANDGTQGTGARARAILLSRGDWIAPLDQDDRWDPGKLTRQLEAAAASPDAGVVFTGWRVIDADGRPTGETRPAGPAGWVYHQLLREDPYCNSAGMIRRDVIPRCGLPDSEVPAGDWDLWLRITRHFPVATVDEPLTDYRLHAANWSGYADRISEARLQVVLRQRHRLHPDCPECRTAWRESLFSLLMYRYELSAAADGRRTALGYLRRAASLAPARVLRPRLLLHALRHLLSVGPA